MTVKTIIEKLSHYNKDAIVRLHHREGEELLFTLAFQNDDTIVVLEAENDNDMREEIQARFDAALEDGKDELLVMSPFHGDTIQIYREKDGKFQLEYEHNEKLEFLHAIWSGKIQGKTVAVIGHRKGNRDLLLFSWENGQYKAEQIDHDCGPANAYGFHKDGKDYVISTNREINEIAMYEFE